MTGKQKVFIDAYFANNFNATKAAEVAGYADPNTSGFQVKNSPKVAEEIERRFSDQAATKSEVLAVLGSQLRSSIADVFIVSEDGDKPVFDAAHAFKTGAVHNIKKYTESNDGSVTVEMYDKHVAAVTIGRHLKLWTDKTEHGGNIGFVEQAAGTLNQKLLSAVAPESATGILGEPDPV